MSNLSATSAPLAMTDTQMQAFMAVNAVKLTQEAPALFENALTGDENEAQDIAQMDALLQAFPDLLGKLLPQVETLPAVYAARHHRAKKLLYLLDNGASTTGLFDVWFKDIRYIDQKHPLNKQVSERLFQTMLDGKAWNPTTKDLLTGMPYLATYITARLTAEPDWLCTDAKQMEWLMMSPKLLELILQRPEIPLPSLVAYMKHGYRDGWACILQHRPELWGVADSHGNLPLHKANESWIEHIAAKLPAAMLKAQLVSLNKDGLTPWLALICDCELLTAEALFTLVKHRRLGVDLAAQRAPKGKTALHLLCNVSGDYNQKGKMLMRWSKQLGIDPNEPDNAGNPPWFYIN